MAETLTIPVGNPHFTVQVQLDNATFNLEVRWNQRSTTWYLHLNDAQGNPILMGRKICLGMPIWIRFRNAALPIGQLAAIDTSGQDIEPGINDLGGRVQLVYTPAAELP